jgi:hypothetical protein
MANVVIPVCGVCGKQGAVEVNPDTSLRSFLEKPDNRRNGFKYGALVGGEWMIFCDACEEKSDNLKDSQERQRQDFFLGK